MEEVRRYLGVSEAARRLGVHPHTLRAWADKGWIKHTRTPSGYRRFAIADIEAFEDEMREQAGKLAA